MCAWDWLGMGLWHYPVSFFVNQAVYCLYSLMSRKIASLVVLLVLDCAVALELVEDNFVAIFLFFWKLDVAFIAQYLRKLFLLSYDRCWVIV